MKITREAGMAKIYTPYNKEFIEKVKNIGGRKWNAAEKCWMVPESEIEIVRKYMMEVFGETDLPNASGYVNIRVKFLEDADAHRNSVVLFGKTIVKATGRDSGAWVGEDATMICGSIGSGGSMKNWRTEIKAGSVFTIRRVAKSALKLDTEYSVEIEILDEPKIDKKALLEERERLIARLAEIEELLKEE